MQMLWQAPHVHTRTNPFSVNWENARTLYSTRNVHSVSNDEAYLKIKQRYILLKLTKWAMIQLININYSYHQGGRRANGSSVVLEGVQLFGLVDSPPLDSRVPVDSRVR